MVFKYMFKLHNVAVFNTSMNFYFAYQLFIIIIIYYLYLFFILKTYKTNLIIFVIHFLFILFIITFYLALDLVRVFFAIIFTAYSFLVSKFVIS
jgi:hypothetical protein